MTENISIIPLIEKWEEFTRQSKKIGVEQFAVWVLQHKSSQSLMQSSQITDPDNIIRELKLIGDYPDIPINKGLAAYIIIRLFKALRFYLKPILQNHKLSNIDDFIFLATLTWKTKINKKNLCQINMTDIPTGMDIIKRLIKQGLVVENENPEDKREKLLILTVDGQTLLLSIFNSLVYIQDVMADLNDNERTQLLKILDRLNNYHTKIYNNSSF